MILEVEFQNFGTQASKFSFSKNSRGPKYYYFLMEIGKELLFTLKNKRRNTNLKIYFLKKYHFGPPKKCVFGIYHI